MTTENEKKAPGDPEGPWLPPGVVATEEEDVEESEAGPGDEDDDEDDDDEFLESYGADLEAPWSPVPLAQAREFLKNHPDAKADFIFPESYAEDRSAKLKDLAVAQGLDYFTHQRAATQAAQEFGFEQFDYHAEMHAIRQEKKEWGDILGQGDALAGRVAGIPTLGAPSVLAPPEEGHLMPRRQDTSGPERAEFRKQQREAFAGIADAMRAISHTVQATARKLAEAGLPAQRLTSAEVLYMVDGGPKRCDRCMMWIRSSNRCSIHAADVPVMADMVCGLYVNGDPMEEGEAGGFVAPQESGLGQGDTSCGNCRYGSGSPTCLHPCLDGFAIDSVGGCCNAWTAPGSQETARTSSNTRRLEEAVARLRERVAAPPVVNVTVPERPVEVHVQPPEVHVAPPEVTVRVETPRRPLTIERDNRGLITKITEEDAGGADRPH